jgi:hypothetical protein
LSQFTHISFEIYLKLSPLMGNYLAKQERLLDEKLSYRARKVPWWKIILQSERSVSFIIWNEIPWCEIILQSKKIIAFMLLIIDKCLIFIELRPKGRIILVVVCKHTFFEWVVWFQNYGTIICVIFRGGGLKINLEDILTILSKNYKRNGLLN